ncbi:hypothetical protein APSETT444_004604 [Aspergillus pseudonomiae]
MFIVIEIALAIAFAVCGKKGASKRNAAAVLEWVIALIFTFYVLSFVVDLLPSVRTRRHVPQGEKRIVRSEMENGMGQPNATIEEPLTTDSAGPNMDHSYYRGQRM